MGILNRLFGQRKMSDGNEVGKATQGGHSPAIPKLVTVLGVFALILLLTSVTSPPKSHAAFPGANGEIVFVSSRDGNFEVYVMDADGAGQTRLTNTPANELFPRWSPDGTKIVFDSGRDGNQEIYVMTTDGSGQTRLTNKLAVDDQPAWSPDGTKIVFDSGRDGNQEIYVMNADGSNQTNLTNNGALDAHPDWQPLPTISVEIDIKPGSDPNCFNNNDNGVIPVAILSSANFDATQVDPTTVELNGQGVRVKGNGSLQASEEDVNSDSFLDLVVQIQDVDGTYQEGDTEAVLTGETFDGIPIEGTDSICIVP